MLPSRLFIPLLLCCLLGCTTTKTSNTARTAREQILISNAVDQALAKVDFTPLSGTKVFIDDKYLDCVDKGYVSGSIRHRAMLSGVTLVGKPEEAEVVMELRSGAVGTDSADSFLGTPEIALPGLVTIPEVKIVSRQNQTALAKLGIMAYDAKTHELLGAGGVSSSMSDDNNWYVMGIGPYQDGTVKQELATSTTARPGRAPAKLPTTVAFREPAFTEEESSRVQLTGDQQEQ